MKERFKIFFGNYHPGLEANQADFKLNKWLDDHPNVITFNWEYQQARMGDHSICISYIEDESEYVDPDLETNERDREE